MKIEEAIKASIENNRLNITSSMLEDYRFNKPIYRSKMENAVYKYQGMSVINALTQFALNTEEEISDEFFDWLNQNQREEFRSMVDKFLKEHPADGREKSK